MMGISMFEGCAASAKWRRESDVGIVAMVVCAATLAAADAGAASIAYGSFLTTVVNFLIVAFVIFLIVKAANRAKGPAPVAAVTTKECPFCLKEVPLKATRCAFCTSTFGG